MAEIKAESVEVADVNPMREELICREYVSVKLSNGKEFVVDLHTRYAHYEGDISDELVGIKMADITDDEGTCALMNLEKAELEAIQEGIANKYKFPKDDIEGFTD